MGDTINNKDNPRKHFKISMFQFFLKKIMPTKNSNITDALSIATYNI